MDNQRFKSVLIIKPSSLGDVIHALPVAASIKKTVPESTIDWVVSGPFVEVVESSPHVDHAIVFDRNMLEGIGALGRLRAFVRELRRKRYTLVIDLQGLLRSGLMCLAARADLKAGFANARECAAMFYGHRAEVPDPEMHAVDRYLNLLSTLGIRTGEPVFDVYPSAEDVSKADMLLNECGIPDGKRFVAMTPSARWETKRWDIRGFKELADRLHDSDGLHTVLLGTDADAGLLKGLGALPEHIHPLFGRTSIKTLVAILSKAAVTITNDSGPMHISAAVGTPTIAVFGPTSHARTGPYGPGHRVVKSDEPCAPCFKRECDTLRCLAGVDVDMVYNEALIALKE